MIKEKINFVFFFDENNFEDFLFSFYSISLNYHKNEFEIYVGTDKMVEEKYKYFFQENCIKVKVINEILNENHQNFKINFPWWKHTNIYTMARIHLFDIFEELYNKKNIIYFDTDIYLRKKVEPLNFKGENVAFTHWTSRSEEEKSEAFLEKYLETIRENKIKVKIRSLITEKKYFNAGVLIINDTKKARKLFNKIKETKFQYDDQTLLNYFNDDFFNIYEMPEYNFMILIEDNIEDPKIIHFASWKKPWIEGIDISAAVKKRLDEYGYYQNRKDFLKIMENLKWKKYNFHK